MRFGRDAERESMPFLPARSGRGAARVVRAPQVADFERDGRDADGGRGIVSHSLAYTVAIQHEPFIHSGDKRFD